MNSRSEISISMYIGWIGSDSTGDRERERETGCQPWIDFVLPLYFVFWSFGSPCKRWNSEFWGDTTPTIDWNLEKKTFQLVLHHLSTRAQGLQDNAVKNVSSPRWVSGDARVSSISWKNMVKTRSILIINIRIYIYILNIYFSSWSSFLFQASWITYQMGSLTGLSMPYTILRDNEYMEARFLPALSNLQSSIMICTSQLPCGCKRPSRGGSPKSNCLRLLVTFGWKTLHKLYNLS